MYQSIKFFEVCTQKVFTVLIISVHCFYVHAADVCIVKNKKAQAEIILQHNAPAHLQDAAEVLSRTIAEMSAAVIPRKSDSLTAYTLNTVTLPENAPSEIIHALKILKNYLSKTSQENTNTAVIYIGDTSAFPAKTIIPSNLDHEGYIILIKKNAVVICGKNDWATAMGVYSFIEGFLDVRWLLPGPDGSDVPKKVTILVPEGTYIDNPAFTFRTTVTFDLPGSTAQSDWLIRQRRSDFARLQFSHSIAYNLIKPELTKSNPELFPMKDGKNRYLPANNEHHGWQPCFSADGSAEIAAANIISIFKNDPKRLSVSLGVNDSSGHCQCPECIKQITGKKNFLGFVDYSDLYYSWCNKIVKIVEKSFPDRLYGCLAYSEVAAAPQKVTLHKSIVPFMTMDRMKWLDPGNEKKDMDVQSAWIHASPSLGWYDYIYGATYCVPRVYFTKMAEYLRYAKKNNVIAHYAELYPNWGEGPKPYVFMKLLWNPEQNIDDLLRDWYVRCVGAEAAPHLAEYYGIWEKFWTITVTNTDWFLRKQTTQYLPFFSADYLRHVKKDDIEKSRVLFNLVLAKAKTDKQKKRAQLLEQAFQYYETSTLIYLYNVKISSAKITSDKEAAELFKEAGNILKMIENRKNLTEKIFPKDAVLWHPSTFTKLGFASENSKFELNDITMFTPWFNSKQTGLVIKELSIQFSNFSSFITTSETIEKIKKGEISAEMCLTRNGSFEEGNDSRIDGWTLDAGKGSITRSSAIVHTGEYSAELKGVHLGGIMRLDLRPRNTGTYYAVIFTTAPENETPKGTMEIWVKLLNENRKVLALIKESIKPQSGKWLPLTVSAQVPEKINEEAVTKIDLVYFCKDMSPEDVIYLDDAGFYKVQ